MKLVSKLFFIAVLDLVFSAEDMSLNSNLSPWSTAFSNSLAPTSLSWLPNTLGGLQALSSGYIGKVPHYGLAAATNGISATMTAAKDATEVATLAQQKVQAAREQVAERIAAAKEVADSAAIQGSEAAAEIAAAVQRYEALLAAANAAQKSVVADASKFYNPAPWTNFRSNYNTWN